MQLDNKPYWPCKQCTKPLWPRAIKNNFYVRKARGEEWQSHKKGHGITASQTPELHGRMEQNTQPDPRAAQPHSAKHHPAMGSCCTWLRSQGMATRKLWVPLSSTSPVVLTRLSCMPGGNFVSLLLSWHNQSSATSTLQQDFISLLWPQKTSE